MKMKLIVGPVALALMLITVFCFSVTAQDGHLSEVMEEIDEHAHELIEVTQVIHDETEKIADDKSLDDDLRNWAEEIHLASHELEKIAEHIHEHIEELENLVDSPSANRAEIDEAIGEIKEHLGEYTQVLESKHDLVHKLLFNVPESHKEYADAAHDAAHEAEGIVEHLEEHLEELEGEIQRGATTTETADGKSPGFEFASAIAGLLAVAYFVGKGENK